MQNCVIIMNVYMYIYKDFDVKGNNVTFKRTDVMEIVSLRVMLQKLYHWQ